MSSAVEAAFAGAMLAPCVRAEDVPRRPLILRGAGGRTWSVIISINR